MNRSEAVNICRYMSAALPHQKMDPHTPDVWAELLADIRYPDAQQAVTNLAKDRTWVAVADIISEVKAIRARRLEANPITDVPAGLTGSDYRDWVRAETVRRQDGTTTPQVEA